MLEVRTSVEVWATVGVRISGANPRIVALAAQ